MKGILLITALMGFGGLWVWAMKRPSSWQQLLNKTVASGNLDALFTELQRKPELVQPRFFDEAMQYLLQTDLDLAVELTLRFVPILPDHKKSQEWLEFMNEQEATTDHFSSEFLERYRRTGCCTGSG